jgi:hypothetical protein
MCLGTLGGNFRTIWSGVATERQEIDRYPYR